jgi:hypothetical protein
MRSRPMREPGGAFVVNLLTSDAPHSKLYERTGYFLLLYFGTGLPKFGIGSPRLFFNGGNSLSFRPLRTAFLQSQGE